MSLAISGIGAGIVLFNFTAAVATVASVMLGLFILAMLALALGPLFSSDLIGEGDVTSRSAAEPSDD